MITSSICTEARERIKHWFQVLPFAAILPFTALVFILATEGSPASSAPLTQPPTLEIAYDPATDLLSIHARQAPLDKTLQEIFKKVHLTISPLNKELWQEQVSVKIEQLPSEQALKKLLEGFNSLFLYSSAVNTQNETTTSRLTKVILLSKKASASLKTPTTQEKPEPAVDQGAKLIQTLVTHIPLEAKKAIEALKELGEKEREKAAEALLEIFNNKDSPARYEAIEALKELAPEIALGPLVDLLQDQNEDRRLRLLAASALGEIGDERVIDPLMWAFENDPLVRRASADSLARIGGGRGEGFLLEVFRRGDKGLRQTAAIALAFQGDDQAKAALTQAIAKSRAGTDVIPKDVFDELSHPKNKEGEK